MNGIPFFFNIYEEAIFAEVLDAVQKGEKVIHKQYKIRWWYNSHCWQHTGLARASWQSGTSKQTL